MLVNSLVPFLYFDVQTEKKEILYVCRVGWETMWWLCKSEYLQRSAWSLCTASCPVITLSFFSSDCSQCLFCPCFVRGGKGNWMLGVGSWLSEREMAGVILQPGVHRNSAGWSGGRDAVYRIENPTPQKTRTWWFLKVFFLGWYIVVCIQLFWRGLVVSHWCSERQWWDCCQ